MKNYLCLIMISCSLLLISSVGYASDGEKTTKSEIVILSADQLVYPAVYFEASPSEMNVIYIIVANTPMSILTDVLVNSVEELCYVIKEDPYELNNLFSDLPGNLWSVEQIDYGKRIHNKGLYNSKINKGYTRLYRSDLIRSNGRISDQAFSC